MENIQNQIQQDEQKKVQTQTKDSEKRARVCAKCGTVLDDDDMFCPNCGEEFGGVQRTCRVCGTLTTSEFCPECGRRVIPIVCPDCGTESYFDFCEGCGKPLTVQVQELVESEKKTVQEMSQEEADKIKEMFETSVSPELEKFQKKIREHQILKQEKEYFNAREKRIKKVFGLHPYEIEFPDLEDEKFIQTAYEGLKATVIHREQEELEEKMNQWKKEQDAIEAKKAAEARERIRKEVEAEFAKQVESVKAEVQVEQHRLDEIERKRREEEERKRREEEERRRLAAEAERKRREEEERIRREEERKRREAEEQRRLAEDAKYNGIYYASQPDGFRDYFKIEKNGSSISAYGKSHASNGMEAFVSYKGIIYGDRINLSATYINPYSDLWTTEFNGNVSSDGHSITGCWISRKGKRQDIITYYKG